MVEASFMSVVMTVLAVPLLVLLLLVVVGVSLLRLCARGTRRGNSAEARREVELIQELHRGMARLDRRVESLETILLERDVRERANTDYQ